MDNFWIVWCASRNVSVVAYANEREAVEQAKRLAITHPTRKFHVMRSVCTCYTEQNLVRVSYHVNTP